MKNARWIRYRSHWFEADFMYCGAEFGVGFWLSILDGHHLTAAIHFGPLDASVDVWLPIREVA